MSIGLPLTLGGVGINDTLPAQVTGLKAVSNLVSGKGQVTVSWSNPGSYFAGVLIVKKTGSAPTSVWDGEKVYDGTGTSFVDMAVAFDTTYYYRAYPYNQRRQLQTQNNVVSVIPKAAKKISELPVGSYIRLNENGELTQFIVIEHNYEISLNKVPKTLLLRKDCCGKQKWNSGGKNDYRTSQIEEWLNYDYLSRFNEDFRKRMCYTSFYLTKGNSVDEIDISTRLIFLLSYTEVGFRWMSSTANQEGKHISYFDNDSKRIAFLNGVEQSWLLRSPDLDSSYIVRAVNKSGGSTSENVSNLSGCRPAFTLPADFLLKPTTNSDGSYSPLEE